MFNRVFGFIFVMLHATNFNFMLYGTDFVFMLFALMLFGKYSLNLFTRRVEKCFQKELPSKFGNIFDEYKYSPRSMKMYFLFEHNLIFSHILGQKYVIYLLLGGKK